MTANVKTNHMTV